MTDEPRPDHEDEEASNAPGGRPGGWRRLAGLGRRRRPIEDAESAGPLDGPGTAQDHAQDHEDDDVPVLHPALRRDLIEAGAPSVPDTAIPPTAQPAAPPADVEETAAAEDTTTEETATEDAAADEETEEIETILAEEDAPSLAAAAAAPPVQSSVESSIEEEAVEAMPEEPAPERTASAEADASSRMADEEAEDRPRALTRRATPISAYLVVLTGLVTAVILAFLLIEPSPRWLVILGAAVAVFGLDGTLRQTWREPFSLGQETAPFLFVPALYVMAVPVLIEHNVAGEAVILAGLGAGLAFGVLAWAELASVRALGTEYQQARVIVTANTYLTGFAVFSLTYVFDLSLAAAVVATGVAAAMLAVEVLREGEIDPVETLGLSLVTGIVLAETRWLFYYVALDTYLAGLSLLLAFYLVTGLLHSHVIRALSAPVVAQYSGIAAAGFALVVVARAAGLA